MRTTHRSGHDGRFRTRHASRPARLLIAVVFSLALRPAQGGAQLYFVTAQEGEPVATPVALMASMAFTAQTAAATAPALAASRDTTPAPMPEAVRSVEERMIEMADRYVGTRYRWGGASPSEGFDCSGFVRYVFAQHGIELPRVARSQARAGRAVPARLTGLQAGDLLFFAQRGPSIDHVAIYAGEGRIVHASRRGYGVRYDDLTGARGRWYAQRLVAVRRVIESDDPPPVLPRDDMEAEAPLGEAIEVIVAGQAEEDLATTPAL